MMQSMLVAWVLRQPCVPLGELTLVGEDTTGEEAIERRWSFWKSFGITFADNNNGTHQVSAQMSSWDLVTPPMPSFHKEGWSLKVPEDLHEVFGLKHPKKYG